MLGIAMNKVLTPRRIKCLIVGLALSAVSVISQAAKEPITFERLQAVKTTSARIALANLDFSIDRHQRSFEVNPSDDEALSAWMDALMTRVTFLGSYSDFDLIDDQTARGLSGQPDNPFRMLERARFLNRIHAFDQASELLQQVLLRLETRKWPEKTLIELKAEVALQIKAINIARGVGVSADLEEAGNRSYETALLSGAFLAADGRRELATLAYYSALEHWDHVSPFAPAWIAFLVGEVWVGFDDDRARKHYELALQFVPQFVKARVHLAELLHAEGQSVQAISLLNSVLASEDPEPAWRYAEFSVSIGMDGVAPMERIEARWQALLEHYPLAFADHAAEFYLAGDTSSTSAIRWASLNFENRPTDEALALLLEAEAAGGLRLCRDDGRPSTHARLMDARRRLIDRGLLCNP